MGSCIGTCGPKEPPQDQDLHDQVHVQDKLVINNTTQQEAHEIDPIAPPSPFRSCSSLSSFSCNTTITSSCSSLSSTSSTASSILTSKDRTFSNEFLWTCIKDNPHLLQTKPMPHVVQVLAPAKQSVPTPKKRVRSGSPNLTRQKSFRKDPPPPDLSSSTYYAPTRTSLRSPSPSRRFNGGGNKVNSNSTKSLSLAKNKENLRPPSPGSYRNNNLSSTRGRVAGHRSGSRNIEAVSVSNNVNGSRLDEATSSVGVGEVDDDDHDILMEDIQNPLISLDCFIFL